MKTKRCPTSLHLQAFHPKAELFSMRCGRSSGSSPLKAFPVNQWLVLQRCPRAGFTATGIAPDSLELHRISLFIPFGNRVCCKGKC